MHMQAARLAFDSWTDMNPAFDHYVLDDAEVDAFVAAHYNESVLAGFRALPLGVMRADIFRCDRSKVGGKTPNVTRLKTHQSNVWGLHTRKPLLDRAQWT